MSHIVEFSNSETILNDQVPKILAERKDLGLENLVGGLECVILQTEMDRQQAAMSEMLRSTGLSIVQGFGNKDARTFVLKTRNSADFLIRSSRNHDNPFLPFNSFPKTRLLPNTRLHTFVYRVKDIGKYFQIQNPRGVQFMTRDVITYPSFKFIQTQPSNYTGNSIGFIEWEGERGDYQGDQSNLPISDIIKPDYAYLSNIKYLDHTAIRVKSEDRDAAILEFMRLTNYTFDAVYYVEDLNSITSVTRLKGSNYAQVFTSGIRPFKDLQTAGPTEKFIHNYGPRVHHMAFYSEHIEDTYTSLAADGMKYLIELVGSREDGLKQTFTVPSENTFLVNEYIYRYNDFAGFFAKRNVTLLTEATGKQ